MFREKHPLLFKKQLFGEILLQVGRFYLFVDASIVKMGYNCKLQLQILKKIGISVKGQIWDLRIAHWALDPDYSRDFLPCVNTIFTLWYSDITQAQEASKRIDCNRPLEDQLPTIPFETNSLSHMARSHGLESWQIFLSMGRILTALRRRGLLRCVLICISHCKYFKLQLHFIVIIFLFLLADMEWYGIGFCSKTARQYQSELEIKIECLVKRAHQLAGKEFNLSFPAECSQILFDVLKLPVPDSAKRLFQQKKQLFQNSKYSSSKSRVQMDHWPCPKEVLEDLMPHHPIVSCILEHRILTKFIGSYIKPLVEQTKLDKWSVHVCALFEELKCVLSILLFFFFVLISYHIERLHPSVQHVKVGTGRLFMVWPNLQCVNKRINFDPVTLHLALFEWAMIMILCFFVVIGIAKEAIRILYTYTCLKKKKIKRYSVLEEEMCGGDVCNLVSRLRTNESAEQLHVIVAHSAEATKFETSDDVMMCDRVVDADHFGTHSFGTLVAVHSVDIFDSNDKKTIQCEIRIGNTYACQLSDISKKRKKRCHSNNAEKSRKLQSTCSSTQKESNNGEHRVHVFPGDQVWRLCAFEKMVKVDEKLVPNPPVDDSQKCYPFRPVTFAPRSVLSCFFLSVEVLYKCNDIIHS
ncbi:hypothetical protein RFI_12925 [Reticulomyxa filosa]|uniref:DNA-directed DNA polymerase family A palm domain-containing protein n=1 Tax=Reticulomyxa filosa TaxID=46433 RepID=X6NE29_RETFI|nr:hypothetical protein RFI_12925 [Reticulomyxa filosa]|eukprot:ETO24236.1 hypothetical protein RFI_12925 [Reticulomyxa filosa]